MRHKWSTQNDINVLINANDGESVLAFIGKMDDGFALIVPSLMWNGDITDFQSADIYETLDEAKEEAEAEVKRRISEFTSPAN